MVPRFSMHQVRPTVSLFLRQTMRVYKRRRVPLQVFTRTQRRCTTFSPITFVVLFRVVDIWSNDCFKQIINGTSVYSTEISTGTTFTSAGGQNYAFSANSTGPFVSVGGSNQVQIVGTDVLTSNGVIHVVDGVMLDTNSNFAAASSALAILLTDRIMCSSHDNSFASATSVAASTTQSGPVTSPSPSPPPHAGAMRGGADNWKLGVLVGMLVGFGKFV